MRSPRFFGFLVLFLVLVSLASAENCAEKSYTASCNKCGFDSNGKMDQSCYQSYQSRGTGCLATAYPIESTMYAAGMCPAVDICINRLQECKAVYTSGNDKLDCDTGNLDQCFINADVCVGFAVKNCSGTPPNDVANLVPPPSVCDDFWFFIMPLFVGAVIFGKRM